MQEKYEISLWDDVWDSNTSSFIERKICVIGSDAITATCRAFSPQLIENIDGTNKFTFKMLIQCRDDTYEDLLHQFVVQPSEMGTMQLEDFYVDGPSGIPFLLRSIEFSHRTYINPFLSYLTNERKVKVLWKDRWYDLIIKNCQEDSEQKTITYTCQDIFINELSKSGLEIVLDNELENNTGNVVELAERILSGTDWHVNVNASELIQQTKEENVYQAVVINDFDAIDDTVDTTTTIPSRANVLVCYSQINAAIYDFSEGKIPDGYFQFAYTTNPPYECADGGMIVTNAHLYSCGNVVYEFYSANGQTQYTSIQPEDINNIGRVKIYLNSELIFNIQLFDGTISKVSSQYKVNRLVRSQKSVYDPLTKKYCTVYKAIANYSSEGEQPFVINDEIYKFTETQYYDPTYVNNLVVNNKGFTSTDGWSGTGLRFALYPLYDSGSEDPYTPHSYLKLPKHQYIYNAGLRYNSNLVPDGFIEGNIYIFRFKAKSGTDTTPSDTDVLVGDCIKPLITNYTYDEQHNIIIESSENRQTYFELRNQYIVNSKWVMWMMRCTKSFSRADIYDDKIGLFFDTFGHNGDSNLWLEEAQLFVSVPMYGHTPPFLEPGVFDTQLLINTIYSYYNHTKAQDLIDTDDIPYIWKSSEELTAELAQKIEPVYNAHFEKILTISAKQSNRYNLLRTLAEKFECYVRFEIEHNPNTGQIIYEDGFPKKWVYFIKEQGQQTGIGFVYGIDLKFIQRTIQSDQIVTKMVVGQNSNQFGNQGFCSIARSRENFSKANFIIDFGYYISQNLLDETNTQMLLNDYYLGLNEDYTVYYAEQEELSQLYNIYIKYNSSIVLYESTINNTNLQINSLWNELSFLTNNAITDDASYMAYINDHPNSTEIISKYEAIKSLQDFVSTYADSLESLETGIDNLLTQIDTKRQSSDDRLEHIELLNQEFYQRFSRFIQEGSWKDDNYIDDNLYYLDALKIVKEAARPKVSYNISVIRVSALEEFKHKIFHLGDIAYIQDTEFFGYADVRGVKTPYREKVLISEITSNFEEPEKDSFKVQNYKTEFEDLFQRINYTSQSYAYSADRYNRINNISTLSGLIDSGVLQDSIDNAKVPITLSGNRITQDATGIIVSDLTQANKQTRITSGGIFVTTDGGDTWKNAVNADGIPTEAISSGVIDIERISIVDSNNKLKWDSNGIIDGSNSISWSRDGIVDANNKITWTSNGIRDAVNSISWTSSGIVDASNKIAWNSDGITAYQASSGSALSTDHFVRLGKNGLELKGGSTGAEGIVYDNNSISGTFNGINVQLMDATSTAAKINRLQIDNNEISYHTCSSSMCEPARGAIRFGANGLSMIADTIIFTATSSQNAAYLTFDIPSAKMVYNWYDSHDGLHTNSIDLKTLGTQNSMNAQS